MFKASSRLCYPQGFVACSLLFAALFCEMFCIERVSSSSDSLPCLGQVAAACFDNIELDRGFLFSKSGKNGLQKVMGQQAGDLTAPVPSCHLDQSFLCSFIYIYTVENVSYLSASPCRKERPPKRGNGKRGQQESRSDTEQWALVFSADLGKDGAATPAAPPDPRCGATGVGSCVNNGERRGAARDAAFVTV